jgi:hypothetical protein
MSAKLISSWFQPPVKFGAQGQGLLVAGIAPHNIIIVMVQDFRSFRVRSAAIDEQATRASNQPVPLT